MTSSEYIESPQEWVPVSSRRLLSVFLAGGITNCPDWQQEMVHLLRDKPFVLLNPRRKNFPIDNPYAAFFQIRWEHQHLRRADMILFWFSAATLCPIVLYELGAWSMTEKPLVVGVEPGYERERDVRIQTELTRPDVPIVSSLTALADEVAATERRLRGGFEDH